MASVPIVLVAEVIQNGQPVGKIHPSRWEEPSEAFPQQLWRAKVHVENVLRGNNGLGGSDIYVYFSLFRGNLTGSASPLALTRGERVMFFLMRDSGQLRTICDGWSTCIERVQTGPHPNFKTSSRYINETVVDLLLTRGDGGTDKAMINTIKRLSGFDSKWGKETLVKKLRQLAVSETPAVRVAACTALARQLDSSCQK